MFDAVTLKYGNSIDVVSLIEIVETQLLQCSTGEDDTKLSPSLSMMINFVHLMTVSCSLAVASICSKIGSIARELSYIYR